MCYPTDQMLPQLAAYILHRLQPADLPVQPGLPHSPCPDGEEPAHSWCSHHLDEYGPGLSMKTHSTPLLADVIGTIKGKLGGDKLLRAEFWFPS